MKGCSIPTIKLTSHVKLPPLELVTFVFQDLSHLVVIQFLKFLPCSLDAPLGERRPHHEVLPGLLVEVLSELHGELLSVLVDVRVASDSSLDVEVGLAMADQVDVVRGDARVHQEVQDAFRKPGNNRVRS